jgi:hypothetical protein
MEQDGENDEVGVGEADAFSDLGCGDFAFYI